MPRVAFKLEADIWPWLDRKPLSVGSARAMAAVVTVAEGVLVSLAAPAVGAGRRHGCIG